MKLNKNEKNFIESNKETLNTIFRKEIDSRMEEVFNMPMGEKREIKFEALKVFKNELRKLNLMKGDYREDKQNNESKKFV